MFYKVFSKSRIFERTKKRSTKRSKIDHQVDQKNIEQSCENRSSNQSTKRSNGEAEKSVKNDARSSSGELPGAPRTRQNRSQEPSERGKSRPRPFENLKVGANGSVGAQKVQCEPQRMAQRGGMNECSIGIIVRDSWTKN